MIPRHIRPKSLRQMLVKAEAQGCTITFTKGHHLRITTPNGGLYFAAVTASDPRSERNIRAGLRQRGVDL